MSICYFILMLTLATCQGDMEALWKSGKKHYFLPDVKGNFFEANRFCRTEGMNLLTIESSVENSILSKALKDHKNILRIWTSGTRLGNEDSQTFYWMKTGKDIEYTNWDKKEPNNDMNQDEHCIQIRSFGGKRWTWNDKRCSFESDFICEKDVK